MNIIYKLYPFGSAPTRINGTPKMHNFSSSDLFPKLCPIVSSTCFNCLIKFCNQIDEVAMGYPLPPVLANIFMGFC